MGKIKRAAVNRLGFTDVEVVGLEKMRKKNLVVSRRRRRERIEWQQKALQDVLLEEREGDSLTARALARLKAKETDPRPCYML
jgi:hypothetical protein